MTPVATGATPVLPGLYPDPSVCRVGSLYYLVNSTFHYQPGLPLHSSTDLVTWHQLGNVVTGELIDLREAPDSGGLYAPTIRHHRGVFYIVCTVVGTPTGAGSFYTSATDPAGPWSAPVFLPDAVGMDPDLFFDGDDAWWAGCRLVEHGEYEGQTEIWLRRLDLNDERLVGQEFVIWNGAVKGGVWSEGPHLYKRDGWFYLLTAEGGTEGNHSVVVARSRSITGPYEGCPRNPVFTHRNLGTDYPVQCVGHADLVENADGNWFALLLGTRPASGHTLLGRETFAVPVAWEQGWPVFNPGVGMLSDALREERGTGVEPFSYHLDLTGATAPDGGWLAPRSNPRLGAPSERGLPLLGGPDVNDAGESGFVGRRLAHHGVDITAIVVPPDDLAARAEFGLLFLQNSSHNARLAVTLEHGTASCAVVETAGGVSTVVAQSSVPVDDGGRAGMSLIGRLSGDNVEFRLAHRGSVTTIGVADARILSTETAGGFIGSLVGPYFTTSSGGPLHLAAFSYEVPRS
ncbi:glycoside hydrolase family 43 protein [Subtercola frigoramans]|uniref:Alpha-N-arabinofuranosidase n=1 Tax=Subtercola frigoramans TaxID=120298 RepID=A0ABS2L066_9MICO|nr:glycoside hydrolase family 43 protein [Subtercola frigoramans]MBM7470473.1 alpha-N-arabinofuranosidase [Subtercola frigoramans]